MYRYKCHLYGGRMFDLYKLSYFRCCSFPTIGFGPLLGILETIHNHDGEAARIAMAEHIRKVSLDIRRYFTEQELK